MTIEEKQQRKVTLTEKQRRFVEAYCGPCEGNATEAARRVGYAHPTTSGPRLLESVGVRDAIAEMNAAVRHGAILTVRQCKEILSRIAQSEDVEPKDRIAAIDKLLKTEGAYLERREVEHKGAQVTFYVPSNGRDSDD